MLKEPRIEELIELTCRVPMPPGYELPHGATEDELTEFESRTGLSLVAEHKDFLRRINGAMIGPGGVFGVRNASDVLSIEEYLKIFPEWRERGWVPIASDGVGNYWVVTDGPDGSAGWVAFVDVHLDAHSVGYYAASSFNRFLNFLIRSELGEYEWPPRQEYAMQWDPRLVELPSSVRPWKI
jgi:hypothetical protein